MLSMASAGTFALLDCEPRQGRKAATVVIEQARSVAGRGRLIKPYRFEAVMQLKLFRMFFRT